MDWTMSKDLMRHPKDVRKMIKKVGQDLKSARSDEEKLFNLAVMQTLQWVMEDSIYFPNYYAHEQREQSKMQRDEGSMLDY